MQYLTKSSIDAVRRFNRYYTRRIGVLQAGLLGSPYSLPQARLLYELGKRGHCTATGLGSELDLDPGYLSRLLHGLKRQGLVHGERSKQDARQTQLSLSAKGRKAYSQLDSRSRAEVASMLAKLPGRDQARVVDAMQAVETLLEKQSTEQKQIVLRPHRPGDIGWVVHRHGALYAEEYGWDERFEALVAGIAKDFVEKHDPSRERCWIAESNGETVGSVFLVKKNNITAQLRLLLVEPKARGRGLGRRLVEECIAFARAKGYRRLVLWTQANLDAARRIYKALGFELRKKEPHQSFGVRLVGEYWELEL